jgi:hypothetical protein
MSELKWTFKACCEEALKYNSRSEYRKQSNASYESARKNKWLNDVCPHMKLPMKPNGYWTLERCQEEALKYNKRKDFQKNSGGAYQACLRNNWSDIVFYHMLEVKRPNGYWTKEKCREEAIKFLTRSEIQKCSSAVYKTIMQNNWDDELFSHMKMFKHKKGYWNLNKCRNEANKYTNSTDFRKGNSKAYHASIDYGWYKEITTLFERYIYSYEFEDNCAYIGLTYNLIKRNAGHKVEGTVFEHMQTTGLKPTFNKLICDPVSPKKASELENIFIEKYKNKGWTILNKAKPGALGGTIIKWTKDKCTEVANQHTTRSSFQKDNGSAYQSASKNGWLDEICSHMKVSKKQTGFYNLEVCVKLANQCKTRKEFKKKFHHAHDLTYKNMWNDIVFANFNEMRKKVNYSLEDCIYLAKECVTGEELKNKNGSIHSQIYENRWHKEVAKYYIKNV